jgi:heptosyltransferase-2
LSDKWIDRILNVSPINLELIKAIEFDQIFNLDKDPLAIALTKQLNAGSKRGFTIDKFGHAVPIGTKAEEHKWLTGLFDDVNKKNNKHYVEEIFDICGFQFNNEEYILETEKSETIWDFDKSKKVIGLNTGCGGRWLSRLWPIDHWVKLANKLIEDGYEVVLLGGEQEDIRNKEINKRSAAKYFGYFPLKSFIDLLDNCDIVVTAVTMAMHLTIGLKKQLVLFNNIFNKNEFYLYNRGKILEPDFDCNCYFNSNCTNNCMQYIYPDVVFNTIKTLS